MLALLFRTFKEKFHVCHTSFVAELVKMSRYRVLKTSA
jgi:hypothetical protein